MAVPLRNNCPAILVNPALFPSSTGSLFTVKETETLGNLVLRTTITSNPLGKVNFSVLPNSTAIKWAMIKFQFQYGTIKSLSSVMNLSLKALFQFQYGTIKSNSILILMMGYYAFQFQYGTI
ncbi:hypothetical protein OZK63_39645, partial [Streptomyces sp. UMAF16]|nr:hypothetical protein [Streptomyces sp. UMAF16]